MEELEEVTVVQEQTAQALMIIKLAVPVLIGIQVHLEQVQLLANAILATIPNIIVVDLTTSKVVMVMIEDNKGMQIKMAVVVEEVISVDMVGCKMPVVVEVALVSC